MKSVSLLLDQFYTKEEIALDLFNKFNDIVVSKGLVRNDWLEPSAGAGAFYNLMPTNKLGIDLDVKADKVNGVIKADFLEYILTKNDYVVLGNPPFGNNSSLAVKFFNKCALHSVIIGFVVPKTFRKQSLQNKLNKKFHLYFEQDLPENSFELDGLDYDVPCVFQIWIKSDICRDLVRNPIKHKDFEFVTKDYANFAIQRVGANAGKVKVDFQNYAQASHYFIKANSDIREVFEKTDWTSVKYNTAGNPSISKVELVDLYEKNKDR